jgi:hypothetical protein
LPSDIRDKIISDKYIKDIFPKIRLDQDTFKAVYRLSLLGVITDFTVDYRAHMISATLKKNNDETYIEELKKYIALYESQRIINGIEAEIAENLKKTRTTVLRESVQYLINFIYSRIANKRKQAIVEMERAIQAGLGKSGERAFEEAVYLYFDSKITPTLRNDLIKSEQFGLDLVWKYIEQTEGKTDEIGHLRGACSRLLIENPENPILFLLMAFANYSTKEYDKAIAQSDFRKGWEIFLSKYEMAFNEYECGIKKFIALTVGFNPFTRKYLESELIMVKIRFLENNPLNLEIAFNILETSELNDIKKFVVIKNPGSNKTLNLVAGIIFLLDNEMNRAQPFLHQVIDNDFISDHKLLTKLLQYSKGQSDSFKQQLSEIVVSRHPSTLLEFHEVLQDSYTATLLVEQIIIRVKKINTKLYEQLNKTE